MGKFSRKSGVIVAAAEASVVKSSIRMRKEEWRKKRTLSRRQNKLSRQRKPISDSKLSTRRLSRGTGYWQINVKEEEKILF